MRDENLLQELKIWIYFQKKFYNFYFSVQMIEEGQLLALGCCQLLDLENLDQTWLKFLAAPSDIHTHHHTVFYCVIGVVVK